MLRLHPGCELGVLAAGTKAVRAHEEIGCGLQGPTSRLVRAALAPLRRRIQKLGEARAVEQAAELTAWLEAQPTWAALCASSRIKGRRVLKDAVLYPKQLEAPAVLQVRHATNGFDYRAMQAPVADWATAHELTSALSRGIDEARLKRLARAAGLEPFVSDLLESGWLAQADDDRAPDEVSEAGLWFLGHNSVLVSSGKTRVLVDPWFRPWRDADPADYRAARPCDVGPVDAIVITHSHGDHFHLGSLLTFPRDTRILVPEVERESILTTDLAQRLKEVGFTRVETMAWWSSKRIGDVEVGAMPFHGEQPSTIDLVDPDLRNHGNTWRVRTPGFSAAFLADTGRDPLGSMSEAALEARRRWGPVDIVFSGMRGFSLAPILLPFTTLDAMFVNVPLDLMGVRQRLMHDAADVLQVAELFGARWAVPYADGGAPWYWREAMGPAYRGYPSYPGEIDGPGEDVEDPKSAPFPERLEEAARVRYGGEDGLVEPLVLRPGDLLRLAKGKLRTGRVEGFAWPYDVDAG